MPRYDGTGPWGQGAGSGWGRGPCGGGRRRGYGTGLVRGWGRGYGRGPWGTGPGVRLRWGRGGVGYGPYGAPGPGPGAAPPDEAQALREEQAYLQSELEGIQKRLAELESSKP